MGIDKIKNIAVIGAGNMGHQIATLCRSADSGRRAPT